MSTPGPLTRLGRYELLEQLGEGGMGAVWLARLSGAAGFEKLCIVKTVLPSLSKNPDFVSRFQHEGRVLTQLQHANIAQVYDMGEAGGVLYLALEYVSGVDLSVLAEAVAARGERMPVPLALLVGHEVAEGLAFAHERRAMDGTALSIVHRDVSPHNVMLSFDGEVKVIDFGIARSEARSRQTAASSVLGKLGYMAPEQALGEAVDHRADQYAAAVMLWECLAGRPYFRRGTMTEMILAMATPAVQPLRAHRPEVSASLESCVLKALSADPAQRFVTTHDFARALQAELGRLQPLVSRLELATYVREVCAETYASREKLLTRLATLKAPPPDAVTPVLPSPPPVPDEALEKTLARPQTQPPAPAPARARRGGPWVALGAALAVVAGAVALVMSQSSAPLHPADPPAQPEAPVVLFNGASTRWTGCIVTAPGRLQRLVRSLEPGQRLELSRASFHEAPAAEVVVQQLKLECAEGTTYLPLRQ